MFTEPGSGWANMTQTAKLTASDGAAGDISAPRFRSAANGGGRSGRANSGKGAAYAVNDAGT